MNHMCKFNIFTIPVTWEQIPVHVCHLVQLPDKPVLIFVGDNIFGQFSTQFHKRDDFVLFEIQTVFCFTRCYQVKINPIFLPYTCVQ